MPKVLADRRDQRLAGERGKAVVRHAKSEQERRGDRQAGGKRGSKGNASSSTLTTSVSIGDNENYFADSYSIAQYFDMGMVPRNEAVLDDYGWDLIMQGMGPETILVHNCREFNQIISECNDPLERLAMQRLLRHLHGLMVMFQSKDPLQWIDAAFQLKNWFQADRDWSFFNEESTHDGSEKHEEGEEEDHDDREDAVDPQDVPRGDREDPGGTDPGREGETTTRGSF